MTSASSDGIRFLVTVPPRATYGRSSVSVLEFSPCISSPARVREKRWRLFHKWLFRDVRCKCVNGRPSQRPRIDLSFSWKNMLFLQLVHFQARIFFCFQLLDHYRCECMYFLLSHDYRILCFVIARRGRNRERSAPNGCAVVALSTLDPRVRLQPI